MTKYYKNLEKTIGFYQAFVLLGCSGIGSLVYFYFSLPETENKTLKEIAEHFDNNKSHVAAKDADNNFV